MPYSKKKQAARKSFKRMRRRGRKKLRKTRFISNQGNAIFMTGTPRGPLPDKYCVKLPYVNAPVSLDPGAGTPATLVYKLNSLYDPEDAMGGHQPLGFDQMAAFYRSYTVIGCKATVSFSNSDGTNSQYVGAFVHASNSPTFVLTTIQEQGMGSYTSLNARIAGHDTATATTVTKWSARKWFGTNNLLSESAVGAQVTADPSTLAYLIVWAYGRSGVDTSAVAVDVRLEYIAVFYNPQYLPES